MRFDRVVSILERDNYWISLNNSNNIVHNRDWKFLAEKMKSLLVNYINQSSDDVKFIIVPHNIKQEQIRIEKCYY